MADTTTIKKITELTTDTTVANTDLFVVGDSGGATLKKMTYQTLSNGIINKLTSSLVSGSATTAEGISVAWKLIPSIGLLRVTISGQPNADLSTRSGYYTLTTVSAIASVIAVGQLRIINYNSITKGQILINTSGQIQLGYTRDASSGTTIDYPSGQSLYINEAFMIL